MSENTTPEEAEKRVRDAVEAFKARQEGMPAMKPGGAVESRPQAPQQAPPMQIFIAAPGVNPHQGWRVGLVWQGDRPGRLVAHNRPMKVVKCDPRSGKIVLKPLGDKEIRAMQREK